MGARSIWIPGSDHGLVWSGGVALLDGSVGPDVVERMWLLLDGGADLPGFLEGLSEACGSGLLGLPGFAIGLVTDQHMHLAVRGDFGAVVADGVEQTRIEGTGVATWTERMIPGGQEIIVSRVGIAPAPGLILVGGIVPAGMIMWRRTAPGVGAAPPSPATKRQASAPAATGHTATIEPAVVRAAAARRNAEPAPAAGETSGTEQAPPASIASDPTPQGSGAPGPGRADGATGSRFDVLWGQTMAHSVEEAAVRQPEDEIGPAPAPSAAETRSAPNREPDLPVPAVPADVPGEPHAPRSRDDVFIDAVPRHYPPPPPRPAAPTGRGAVGDHDGETVAREELGQVIPAGPAAPNPGFVPAAMCPEQHPNSPGSSECRICRRPVGTATSRIPQPVIGRAHMSTGESFDLSGSLIVGRNPRASRFQGTQVPRLVSLPFAHISGSHLELRVDGWSLLAVDLNSTNGTFLRRGGEPPKRIPDTPTPLYAGDVLDFGDDVKMTFEFIP